MAAAGPCTSTPSPSPSASPPPTLLFGAGEPCLRLRVGAPPKPKRELRVAVVLLDGRRLEVVCDVRHATVGDVFECACRSASLQERPVALAAALCGELVFPPPSLRLARLARLAPAAWAPPSATAPSAAVAHAAAHAAALAAAPARGRRSRVRAPPAPALGLTLLLRLWLILPALPQLSDACGRRLLFLELRRRAAEGRLRGACAQLRAMHALARRADAARTPARERAGYDDDDPHAGDAVLDFVAPVGAHRPPIRGQCASALDDGGGAVAVGGGAGAGVQPEEQTRRRAEDAFVAAAARLPLAGAHCLDAVWVQRAGASPGASSGPRPVTLAVAADAFSVLSATTAAAEAGDGTPATLLRVPWPCVRSLRHGARALRVTACLPTPTVATPAAPAATVSHKMSKLKFYLPHKKSLFLFHLASLHHQVYLNLQNQLTTILPSQDIQSMCNFKKSNEHLSNINEGGFAFEEDSYKENNMFHRIMPCIPMQTPQTNSSPESDQRVPNNSNEAFVLKSHSTNSNENFDVLHETLSDSLIEKFEELSFVDERMLFTVRLRREKEGNLGLQVECGLDGGVYIQGCSQPATNISKGDRIIAINGRSLMHLKYTEALEVIKSTGSDVEFIVSRSSKSNRSNQSNELSSLFACKQTVDSFLPTTSK